MAKKEQRFSFPVPVTKTSLTNLVPTTTFFGDITIKGVGSDNGWQSGNEPRFVADIDSVVYNGAELFDLFENFQPLESVFNDLKQLADEHVEVYVFNAEAQRDTKADEREEEFDLGRLVT